MKKLALLVGLAACGGVNKNVYVHGLKGDKGDTGANGHSLVSEFLKLDSESEECLDGGTRLDIFLDADDNLEVSEGDTYTGSLVACNGANGLNGATGATGAQGPQGMIGPQGLQGIQGAVGPQGPQGIAGPAGPVGPQGPQGIQGAQGLQGIQGPAGQNATASITAYTSTSCTSITGTSYFVKAGSNASIYTASNCHSSSKVEELNDGHSFWVSSNMLAVDNNGCVRVIKFN